MTLYNMTFNGLEALRPGTDGLYSKKSLTESKNRAFSPTSAADDIENFLKNKLHGDDGSCGYNECVFMPLTFPGVGEQNNNTSHHPKPKLRNLRDPKRAKSQHSQTIPVRSIPGHREQLQQFQQKCNDEGRTPESLHESRFDVSHEASTLGNDDSPLRPRKLHEHIDHDQPIRGRDELVKRFEDHCMKSDVTPSSIYEKRIDLPPFMASLENHPNLLKLYKTASELPHPSNNDNDKQTTRNGREADNTIMPTTDTDYAFGELVDLNGVIISMKNNPVQNDGM